MFLSLLPSKKQKTAKTNEAAFLAELLEACNRWEEKGEAEYSAAYKLLLHKFTAFEDTKQ